MSLKKSLLIASCLFSLMAAAPVAEGDSPPPPVATHSGFVCPTGHNRYDIHAWIHVVKWCIVPGVRNQVQVKVQMKIHNSSGTHSLDIRQDKIRLVVRRFDRDRWTPPRVGAPTVDRPIETTYHGETVWAIPANAEGAFDYIPHEPGIGTFATHWHASFLGPDQTFDPRYHHGDLVFYLPRLHSSSPLQDIVGIAFIKNADILALCDPEVWGRHVAAASF